MSGADETDQNFLKKLQGIMVFEDADKVGNSPKTYVVRLHIRKNFGALRLEKRKQAFSRQWEQLPGCLVHQILFMRFNRLPYKTAEIQLSRNLHRFVI